MSSWFSPWRYDHRQPRHRRDSRDYAPRDIDTDRAERHPRDGGPGSAGSNISESPRFANAPFRGSSYSGRGRGRPEWEYRGRSRAYPHDERDTFRPRSRSRGRHERDRSVDSRDYDRRDDRRDDYRRDDDWHYRRHRADERDYNRRDPPPRSDLRHSDSTISPAERSRGVSPHRRPSPDLKRDYDPPRRQSTVGDLPPLGAGRRDIERTDSSSLRQDSTRDRNSTRQSEPDTHMSVAVPQFGSIPTLPLSASAASVKTPITPITQTPKTPVTAKPSPGTSVATQNDQPKEIPSLSQPPKTSPSAMIAPQAPKSLPQAQPSVSSPSPVQTSHQARPVSPATSPAPTQDQAIPKPPPVAPRAQLGLINPPTGPKADRLNERERMPSIGHEGQQLPPKETKARDPHPSPGSSHILPTSSIKAEPQPQDSVAPHRNIPVGSPVMAQRLAPPTGPRASSSQSFPRAASAGPYGRDLSPTQSQNAIPLGPRVNSSHKGLPDNVPTGPKAQRIPPTAPRMQKLGGVSRPVTSLQWRAPPQPVSSRPSTIPAKRDVNGEEKERTHVPDRPGESYSRASTFSLEPKPDITNETSQATLLRKQSGPSDALSNDVQMTDAPATRSPEALAFDTDDDGMDLNEEDFQAQEARFKEKKGELEKQYTDLEDHWRNRISSLIEESDRLRGILDIIGELPLPESPPPKAELPVVEQIPSPPKEPDSPVATTETRQEDVPMQEVHQSTPPKSRLGSPDLNYLPYLAQRPPTPVSDQDQSVDRSDDDVKDMLSSKLQDIEDEQADFQDVLRSEYVSRYREWKHTRDAFEKAKEETEAALAQSKMEVETPEPPVEPAPLPLPTPNTERRRHQFTSALDLQRVLEESRKEEEARREKAEREAKEAQASAEKEAEVPAMLSTKESRRRIFKDTSLLRTTDEALRVFEYAPPADTFTEEEDRRLRDQYDQGTKMWHKIADAVGRTTKECINHYYATKWDQPYKRQKNKRAKRNKKGTVRRPEAELQAQETTIGLTETGRPRRAAAPTFSSKVEKNKAEDVDAEGAGGKKSLSAKNDSAVGEEKATRGRKPGKEKPGRKPRAHPLNTKAVPSPQKMLKEKKDKLLSAPEPEDLMAPLPPQPLFGSERLMPVLIPQQSNAADPAISVLQNKLEHPPSMTTIPPASIITPVTERPRSHSQSQRQGPSSYWSVPEEAEFKECLKYFGTDFNAIANHMGKKTAVMIKNHFQKYRQDETKNADVLTAAALADQKRERGESLGTMPPTLRKRPEPMLSTPSRSIIPSTEMMETDSPPSTGALHGSPHFPTQGRLQALQQQATSAPHGFPHPTISAPGSQPKQPRMGFFSSDGSPVKTHIQPQPQTHMSPVMGPMPDPPRQPKQQSGRIKTEYEPRPVISSRHEPEPRQTPLQAAMQSVVQNVPEPPMPPNRITDQDRLPEGIRVYQGAPQLNLGPNISVRPMVPEGPISHPPAPQPRQYVDLTAPPPMQKLLIEPLGRSVRPHSPSVQIYSPGGMYQPPSTMPPSQASTPRPQAPPTNPPAPSRKVNIMSMLNPEPAEEEKPRKKEPERAPPPPPPSHIPMADHYVSQQDPYRDGSRHGHRPMYSAPHIPTAVSEGANLGNSREWPNRPSYVHPPSGLPKGLADSPRLQAQPLGVNPVDMRGPRDYRAVAFGGLNNPGVPSPPPGPGPYGHAHSRTSSYSAQGPPGSGPPGPPHAEAYASGPRGGYPPHSSAPPQPQPRGPPMHAGHPYQPSYSDSPMMPGGHMEHRPPRELGMRSNSGSYRGREYEVPPPSRDPRDTAGHPHPPMYGGHTSPQPAQDPRYANPPPPPRSTHTPLGQGYPGDVRGLEGPRGYEPPLPDARERDPRDPRDWYSSRR